MASSKTPRSSSAPTSNHAPPPPYARYVPSGTQLSPSLPPHLPHVLTPPGMLLEFSLQHFPTSPTVPRCFPPKPSAFPQGQGSCPKTEPVETMRCIPSATPPVSLPPPLFAKHRLPSSFPQPTSTIVPTVPPSADVQSPPQNFPVALLHVPMRIRDLIPIRAPAASHHTRSSR